MLRRYDDSVSRSAAAPGLPGQAPALALVTGVALARLEVDLPLLARLPLGAVHVLGVGEFEGQLLTLAQANAKWKLDATGPADLRRQAAGSSVATLTGALKSAKSRPEADTGPRECNPTDS